MFEEVLRKLYNAAGALAALFMIGTLVMVVLSIAGRLLDFQVPGTDAYAGYCTAAAGFLALAYTLRRGEHIRVTLFQQRFSPSAQRVLDVLVHGIGGLLAVNYAWFSIRLMVLSHEIEDISTATDATPLWIPQLGMAIGTTLLAVAVIHGLVNVLCRRVPLDAVPSGEEPGHIE